MRNILVFIVLSVLFSNCKKDIVTTTPPPPPPPGTLPTITTSAIGSITTTGAISGGNVSADGGSPVTERGVCWGITSNPVITGNRTTDGTGTGIFTSSLVNLTANTTYYLRAYAKNTQGIGYGNQIMFQTNTPPLAPGDSANLFFITAASNTTGRSFITYNVAKNKIWEITNYQSVGFWNTPAYENGKLYIASFNSMLSLNAANGGGNWTYTNASFLINPKLKNDTLVTAGSSIAPSSTNAILLINKNTGNVIWDKVVTDQPVGTPVLNDGKIFNLTTNGTGTNMKLSAYDVVTKNLIWQQLLVNGFFTAAPPDMIVRNDSLIVFSSNSLVHLLNKNTGAIHWSKTLGTFNVHLYKNDLVFNDAGSGRVTVMSLQTGNIILQSNPINYTMNNGSAYIYNDAFYNVISDSVFCTSLLDGSLKWRKRYGASAGGFYKFIAMGHTVYGARQFDNANDESKLIILNAMDFTAKDSIIIPKRDFTNFSILSSAGKFY
ncbi:MAG TPA: PQQ-binding-like beta-propeller repeat protein [Ferruginibacter sp.]|nr:PQQ-binding-like beta-propeller repeat protein [Ferruginibacter sp.]